MTIEKLDDEGDDCANHRRVERGYVSGIEVFEVPKTGTKPVIGIGARAAYLNQFQ
jgi:hypothetical protein